MDERLNSLLTDGMSANDLSTRLAEAIDSSDFQSECEVIVGQLKEESAGLDSVVVILKFMEENPDGDFGIPGPLTHFVETFYHRGYEIELITSLERQPTPHTVWLLNRLINGTKEAAVREELVGKLRDAKLHSNADADTRDQVSHFLQRLSNLP